MRWWQIALVGLVAVVFAAALPVTGGAQTPVVVTAAMSGQVLPLQLAKAGQAVKRGDVLMFVQTATSGAVPAAVARVDGTVVQVMVSPGVYVHIGDAVVSIAPH